jgi:hypothetical protein
MDRLPQNNNDKKLDNLEEKKNKILVNNWYSQTISNIKLKLPLLSVQASSDCSSTLSKLHIKANDRYIFIWEENKVSIIPIIPDTSVVMYN